MAEEPDEHIMEAIGRCRVVIRNGIVVEVGDPIIASCPLAKKMACPVQTPDRESVKANIENRIRTWGMCTPRREVTDARPFVGFGASEILSFGLSAGCSTPLSLLLTVPGRLLPPIPSLSRGSGGGCRALLKPSPIPEVIRRIEEHGGTVIRPGPGLP